LGGVDISIFGSNQLQLSVNSLTIGLLPSLFLALGEEIGWRGLLVPRWTQSLSFRNTALPAV
jgi:membrane protease YdiL (CAAX protease family)